MATKKLYVVVAMPNNGGHGPWPAPILVTENGRRAVAVARVVETLGWRTNWREEGVYIFLVELEEVYARIDYKVQLTNPYIYKRAFDLDGKFAEYFFDAKLAEECNMSTCLNYAPSKPLSPATNI